MSDRATACPGCGAPVMNVVPVAARPSTEEWALSRLTAGLPRRQVVDEIVSQGILARTDAETLVKGVEAAALEPADERSKWMLVGAGRAAMLLIALLVFLMLMRALAG